jgi:hypothetical protein
MPGAKGKAEIKVVLPEALKARLDADAAEYGMDRSALICQRLQDTLESQETHEVARRLGELARDSAVMRDELTQLHGDLKHVVTLIETFMAAVSKPSTPAEKVYPTPATWEETYPELYAPKPQEPTPPVTVEEPRAPVKRWPWQR